MEGGFDKLAPCDSFLSVTSAGILIWTRHRSKYLPDGCIYTDESECSDHHVRFTWKRYCRVVSWRSIVEEFINARGGARETSCR